MSDPGSWQGPWFDEDAQRLSRERLFAADDLLLGRATYVMFGESWPGMPDETGFVDRINGLPKHVVSSTLEEATWGPARIVRPEDLVAAVTELKSGDGGDILVYGFGRLAHSLLENGLLDVAELWFHPVLVGATGEDDLLARRGSKHPMRLESVEKTGSGVLVCSYAPSSE
ncbi:dihydrofolate reductase family protein [Actinokineospora soli]|uniref:Dihydrofolate reductase family protein n=1 Tax=Actinokineospora soli TaxID=1048753 RepID=A0ABW2TJD9_9PSEU